MQIGATTWNTTGVLAHVDAVDTEARTTAEYGKEIEALLAEPSAAKLPHPGTVPSGAPESLVKNRRILDEHLDAIESELTTALRGSLQVLETELTKAGKITEARTVRDFRENRIALRTPASEPMPPESPDENWVRLTVGNKGDDWKSDGKVKWLIGGDALTSGSGASGILSRKLTSPWFELRGEFRTTAEADGGVHFHFGDPARFTDGYELQLAGTQAPGRAVGTGGLITSGPGSQNLNAPASAHKDDTPLPFRLVSTKDRIQAWVNGVQTFEFRRPAGAPSGVYLGVSKQSDEGTLTYRNLRIRELPETAQVPSSSSPATSPAQPSPAAPIASGESLPQKNAIDWLLSIGADLVVRDDRRQINVRDAQSLPNGKLDLIRATLNPAASKSVTPAGLALLAREKSLVSLDLALWPQGVGSLEPLSGLVALENLRISGPGIPEDEMAHLAALTKLRSLTLAIQKGTGEGCRHLKELKSLRDLRLERCVLTDKGAEAIAQLTNLTTLTLGDSIRDTNQDTLRFIGTMKNIRSLSLESSRVTTHGFARLAGLNQLESVTLNNCKLDNDCFASLKASAGTLRSLQMQYNATVSDDGMRQIVANFPNLEDISASTGSTCTAASIRELAKLPKLKSLAWWVKDVPDADYMLMADLPAIESITLNGTSITDAALPAFSKCRTLKRLVLNQDKITDAGLESLKHIRSLENLQLKGTQVTATGVATFQKARPEVKVAW